MNIELLTQNWALAIASVLSLGIFLFVLFRLYEGSGSGRLNFGVAELRKMQQAASAASKAVAKAEERLAKLLSKADTTKPKLLSEAEEAVADARSMQKITGDQVLRAKKVLGDVILEEFSPKRQDVLRDKYL